MENTLRKEMIQLNAYIPSMQPKKAKAKITKLKAKYGKEAFEEELFARVYRHIYDTIIFS